MAKYAEKEAPLLERIIMQEGLERSKAEDWARDEITRLREENALLEERNKKLNDDLLKQSELTAVTMTRCADLMPAQLVIVKLKEQQVEIEQLREENARLREALKPFAKNYWSDDWHDGSDCEINVQLRDIRRAAAAIREGGKDEN